MANIKKNKKYHYTYKTTNLINGRYYLGMHSTNRLDDGYLGSGKRLYYELNKYGRDNFKFEILEQFDSREELVQAEISLITEQDLQNPNCLNLKSGGSGGFSKEDWEKGQKVVSALLKERWKDPEYREKMIRVRQEGVKRLHREGKVKYDTFTGKKHTPETIQKMKESHKGAGKGSSNSQYGTCWITDEYSNKKIYKGETIPEGWRLGRKINKGL
jgi:hypothetical protein